MKSRVKKLKTISCRYHYHTVFIEPELACTRSEWDCGSSSPCIARIAKDVALPSRLGRVGLEHAPNWQTPPIPAPGHEAQPQSAPPDDEASGVPIPCPVTAGGQAAECPPRRSATPLLLHIHRRDESPHLGHEARAHRAPRSGPCPRLGERPRGRAGVAHLRARPRQRRGGQRAVPRRVPRVAAVRRRPPRARRPARQPLPPAPMVHAPGGRRRAHPAPPAVPERVHGAVRPDGHPRAPGPLRVRAHRDTRFRIMSVLSFTGRFYCIVEGKVMVVETAGNQPPRLVVAAELPMPTFPHGDALQLVENARELMLVHRSMSIYTRKYEVYRVDLEARKTIPVHGLDGNAMFIGMFRALSVSPKVFPSISADTIYPGFELDDRTGRGKIDAYYLADRSIEPSAYSLVKGPRKFKNRAL
ncbi:hypothetical protein SEVIR_2G378150v4 [Setaria viridis]